MTDTETECQGCGETVSTQFVRVFAEDEEEGVYACPACVTAQDDLRNGACRPPNPTAMADGSGRRGG